MSTRIEVIGLNVYYEIRPQWYHRDQMTNFPEDIPFVVSEELSSMPPEQKIEHLSKQFNDVKAQEENLLTARKALEEQLESTSERLRMSLQQKSKFNFFIN